MSLQKGTKFKNAKTHGLSKTKFYTVWAGMKQRCTNPNYAYSKNYGGRGITLCEEWYKFINFYNDMYPTFRDGLLLDRIDNNKGYSKNNCRWVDWKVQNNNKRNNRFVALMGRSCH